LSIEIIYVFLVILSKQQLLPLTALTSLYCNSVAICFLWGRNWIANIIWINFRVWRL